MSVLKSRKSTVRAVNHTWVLPVSPSNKIMVVLAIVDSAVSSPICHMVRDTLMNAINEEVELNLIR